MASADTKDANGEDKLAYSLRRESGLASSYLYLFQEFWCPGIAIEGVKGFQKYFQAKDNDVVVASFPKTGTTWLIALTFAIVNRQYFSTENHPLLTSNPHTLVPCLEFKIFCDDIHDPVLHLSNMLEPRLFSTHTPFTALPKSITESNAKIVYICRNPFDTFISAWTYFNKIRSMSLPALELEEAFEMYCNGIVSFGPWWSHMLGYWKESMARPNKVLFLKYEDLKENVNFYVKNIAEFLGCPFTAEEERVGEIESIIKLCSFEKMKELEVNISGKLDKFIDNKFFFRKGEIGDWVNYFSPSMVNKLSKIIEEKLCGSGLSFKICS
ncbi:cytosolic sulfotransferase 15-like [Vigna radiata var. radiata]|uniref:Sulfotransferase n=1 Tax=Vigna radiata var. radiata TaxID=3916 RepID=A0A1S3UAX9_VIGRR|nr:cytosolic sulfotransferase 15-like [Vigna radiata var. radiata]